jgi:hypothetical protein
MVVIPTALFLMPAFYAIMDDLGWLGAIEEERDEDNEKATA